MFQLLADGDDSHILIPSFLSPPSSDFSVPKHAVWINSLWFLSLVISIMCALSATFVQQWAHRYVKVAASEEPYSVHRQARIHAFFAEGLDKSRLPLVVGLIPTFLHLSVFLFFAGLCVFLFHLNPTVFNAVVSCVGVCVFTYLCIIIMPILRYDTPYHSPLSSLAWYIWTGVLHILFVILCFFQSVGLSNRWFTHIPYFSHTSWQHFHFLQEYYRKRFLDGIQKVAEASAQKLSHEIDGRALVWTVRSLDGDDKQEQFFANIPAFCDSKVLSAPLDAFKGTNGEEMSKALFGFLHHTLSSNLDQESKQRRINICRNAMDAASLYITWPSYQRVLYEDWTGLLSSVEFGLFLRAANYSNSLAEYNSNHLIAAIIATVQEHDHRWLELAAGQLGKSRAVLESYLTHGKSVLLADCIDICRRMVQIYSENDWFIRAAVRFKSLEIVSDFDARNTLPGLQHDFCRLWNDLIRMTGDSANRRMQALALCILRHIRKIYIALHQDTDSAPTAFDASTEDYADVLFNPSSYPSCSCNIPTVTPPTAPVVPSSPALHSSHSTTHLAYETSLSEVPDTPHPTTQVAASSRLTQERPESHQGLATSRDIAIRGATQGATDLAATASMANSGPLSTLAASTSIPLQVIAPSHTHLARLDLSFASSQSQLDQTPWATAMSLVSPPVNLNVADTDPVEASHDLYRTAWSGPDGAQDVPLLAPPSPHGPGVDLS